MKKSNHKIAQTINVSPEAKETSSINCVDYFNDLFLWCRGHPLGGKSYYWTFCCLATNFANYTNFDSCNSWLLNTALLRHVQ